jgi:hypothetical protein
LREIYYFGPNVVSCSEKEIVTHRNYTFELYRYDIKGNGKLYLKVFDSEKTEVFGNLTICLSYNWHPGYYVEFYNNENLKSLLYFQFKSSMNFSKEKVLDRIVLMAEKNKKINEANISFQYVYAYIIFLFLELRKDQVNATQFSYIYSTLKKMRTYISWRLTDNVQRIDFSTDTLYYKVFDKFINIKLEELKSKVIIYD